MTRTSDASKRSGMEDASAPRIWSLLGLLLCRTLAGAAHAGALAGPVVGWKADNYGQTTSPNAVSDVSGASTFLASGGDHSCAIQAGAANAVCWGSGVPAPVAVNGVSNTAMVIAADSYHTL